jgi:hypothetical protein
LFWLKYCRHNLASAFTLSTFIFCKMIGIMMSPDFKLKLSSIQLMVEESIKISSKALQIVLMHNAPTTASNDINRQTSYASLYNNCSVEISSIQNI